MRLGFRPKIFTGLLEKAKRKQSDSFSQCTGGTPRKRNTWRGENLEIHPSPLVGTKGRETGGGKKSCWHSGSRDPGTGTWGGGRSRSKGEEVEKEKDPSFVEELSPENLQFLLAILRLHFFAYVHHVTDQPVQKLIFKGSSTLTRSLLLLDKSSIPLLGEEGGRGEGLKLDRRPFDISWEGWVGRVSSDWYERSFEG